MPLSISKYVYIIILCYCYHYIIVMLTQSIYMCRTDSSYCSCDFGFGFDEKFGSVLCNTNSLFFPSDKSKYVVVLLYYSERFVLYVWWWTIPVSLQCEHFDIERYHIEFQLALNILFWLFKYISTTAMEIRLIFLKFWKFNLNSKNLFIHTDEHFFIE